MPDRILLELKILVGSVVVAIAVPYLDLVLRFLVPIISGIVWIFLKPYVIKLKNNYKNKQDENN